MLVGNNFIGWLTATVVLVGSTPTTSQSIKLATIKSVKRQTVRREAA